MFLSDFSFQFKIAGVNATMVLPISRGISRFLQLLSQEENQALFIDCRAQKLNLVVQDVLRYDKNLRNWMALLTIPVPYFFYSWIYERLSWFCQFIVAEGDD